MDLSSILYPLLSIGGMGLLFGLGLGYAGRIFYVKEDPRIGEVRDALPGANCGGCGFAGCDAFAFAVASGNAPVNGCPVGGGAVVKAMAEIMGQQAEAVIRREAYVKCAGNCDKAAYQYEYFGLDDCSAVNQLAGNGPKTCTFGCLGNGSCLKACAFDAINIVNGIAEIDTDKCTACGRCVATCPRRLIEILPVEKYVRVGCNSRDSGKTVKGYCAVGCISCKLCEKACGYDAVHVNTFLAEVDYDKCVLCGACVKKCPTDAIREVDDHGHAKEKAAV